MVDVHRRRRGPGLLVDPRDDLRAGRGVPGRDGGRRLQPGAHRVAGARPPRYHSRPGRSGAGPGVRLARPAARRPDRSSVRRELMDTRYPHRQPPRPTWVELEPGFWFNMAALRCAVVFTDDETGLPDAKLFYGEGDPDGGDGLPSPAAAERLRRWLEANGTRVDEQPV